MSLQDLQAADWELGLQEINFNQALQHKKFEKISPKPIVGKSFAELRTAIKEEIRKKENANP